MGYGRREVFPARRHVRADSAAFVPDAVTKDSTPLELSGDSWYGKAPFAS
jgi:hypothetical protein